MLVTMALGLPHYIPTILYIIYISHSIYIYNIIFHNIQNIISQYCKYIYNIMIFDYVYYMYILCYIYIMFNIYIYNMLNICIYI